MSSGWIKSEVIKWGCLEGRKTLLPLVETGAGEEGRPGVHQLPAMTEKFFISQGIICLYKICFFLHPFGIDFKGKYPRPIDL